MAKQGPQMQKRYDDNRGNRRANEKTRLSAVFLQPPDQELERAFETGKMVASIGARVSLYTEVLAGVLTRVLDAYVFVQSMPEKWQAGQLKKYLQAIEAHEGKSVPDMLWEAIGLLRDAYSDALEFHTAAGQKRPFDPDFLFEQTMIQIADDLRAGVRNLIEGKDGGESLGAAIRQYQDAAIASRLKAARASRPQLGRPHGATPVNQYILDETRRLAQLHNLKTAGQKVDCLRHNLEQRADVRAWLDNPPLKRLAAQSIEVQAYARLRDMGGDDLRALVKNTRRRANWGG